MGKNISFRFNDEDYKLEFSKRTVKEMEDRGFDITSIGSKPMTMIPLLFEGAFQVHHRKVKQETINAIYKQLPDKEKLWTALIEIYNDPLEALSDEPDEKSGNIDWTMNG